MKNDSRWLKGYKLALFYYLKNGNLEVPTDYRVKLSNGDVIFLGTWIHNQRMSYKRSELSESRIELLELIDMVWDMSIDNGFISAKWMKMYEIAKKYYNEHGNLFASKNCIYTVDGVNYNLGQWLTYQRRCSSTRKEYKITKKQIRLLNKIGMVWSFKEDDISPKWMFMYELARKFFDNNALYNVRYDYIEEINGKKYTLGLWISRQRSLYKRNQLSKKKIDLLENIGMVWDLNNKDEIALKLSK